MAQIGLEVGLFMNLLVSRKKLLGNTGDFLWIYGGYLIVSALCDLCGVVLDESNARNFITDCIESLHDTLKDNLNINGVNYALSLNDDLISKFIEFYKGKEGTLIDSKFEIASPNLDLPFKFSQGQAVWKDLCSFKVNQDCQIKPQAFCKGTDSISSLSLYGSYSSFSKGDVVSYKCAWDINSNYYYMVNIYKNGSYVAQSYQGYGSANPGPKYLGLEFWLRVDTSLINKDTFRSFVGATYPSVLGDIKTLEEYKAKYENEPSRIILDSSIVNIKTKWKKESADIYIPDGNVENLPNGVKILYGLWVYNTGDQFTEITGGWENYHNDTNWFWSGYCYKGDIKENYLSFSIKQDKSMCSLATSNKINFEEVNKIKITYSRIANTNAHVAIQFVDNLQTGELTGAKLQVGHDKFTETENLETYNTIEISYPNPITLNGEFYVLVVLWGELAEYKETFRIKSIYIR